ncbi:MAG: substrate-binding domain-containing protein [Proteobacteria bacterium]|nr:substrate-binding domain-containing protein [Pseudomonadota bacterium]
MGVWLLSPLALALAAVVPARAADLRVIAGGGIAVPLDEIAAQFEQTTGHKVVIRYGTAPELIEIATTTPFDLAVTPSEVFKNEGVAAHLAPGPTTEIAHVGLGVAVHAGAPRPDIGTPEALKRALLHARTVATIPASAAGARVMKLFERLGIANDVRAKLQAAANPAKLVEIMAGRQAEIGIFTTNVLTANGLDVVGPVPAELDYVLSYTGGIARDAAQAESAREFLDYLKSPQAKAVLKARALIPG